MCTPYIFVIFKFDWNLIVEGAIFFNKTYKSIHIIKEGFKDSLQGRTKRTKDILLCENPFPEWKFETRKPQKCWIRLSFQFILKGYKISIFILSEWMEIWRNRKPEIWTYSRLQAINWFSLVSKQKIDITNKFQWQLVYNNAFTF